MTGSAIVVDTFSLQLNSLNKKTIFIDNSATSFLSPSSGAGGGAGAPVSTVHSSHTDLIYDSINMSQVQNYSPSLSSSLGEQRV